MDVDVIGDEDDEMYHNSAGAIPQALIKDALRKIHLREGIFTEEDMNQLENGGYSVSESDGDESNGIRLGDGDIMSKMSGLSAPMGGLMSSPD